MPTAASTRLARRVRLVLSLAAARAAYGEILDDTTGSLAVVRRLDALVAIGNDLLFAECLAQRVTEPGDPPARIEEATEADLLLVTFENRAISLDVEGNFARM